MKAPSIKVSIIFLITILIVTSIISFTNYKKKLPKEEIQNSKSGELNLSIEITKDPSLDSDNDGLLDWEESLWGTDPKNPDTDGDGTKDGEEINLNRDPLTPGPNDENYDIEKKISENLEQIKVASEGLTNQVALELVNQYFTLKQSGQLDAETKQNLIQQISATAFNEIKFEDVYSINFIETFDPKDEERLITYANNIVSIQTNTSFQSATLRDNITLLSELYVSASQNLVSIEVPNGIVQEHVALANNFYKISEIVKNFGKEKEDPLLAMFTLRIYSEIQQEIVTLNEKIGIFLRQGGIINDGNELKIKSDE
jgi:hypothetical protein